MAFAGQFEFVLVDVSGFSEQSDMSFHQVGVCRAGLMWGRAAGFFLSIWMWTRSLQGRGPISNTVISAVVHLVMILLIESLDLPCLSLGAPEHLQTRKIAVNSAVLTDYQQDVGSAADTQGSGRGRYSAQRLSGGLKFMLLTQTAGVVFCLKAGTEGKRTVSGLFKRQVQEHRCHFRWAVAAVLSQDVAVPSLPSLTVSSWLCGVSLVSLPCVLLL